MKEKLLQKFQLGGLELPNGVFYSPLAGCSDFPFRAMSARYKPALIFCEMVKMEALIRGDQNTFHILDYDAAMHPIGGQLVGSNVKIAGKAAKLLEAMGFDVIDFNCGCPVDKVTKDGSGSAMLKTPELIGEILQEIKAAVSVPVTVKIRAGWDESSINAPEIVQVAERAGADAVFIHGRTRKQGYNGPANWSYIKDCVDARKTIKVIGNGDVVDGPSAEKMLKETGCDGVLVSRATMGQPWIVEEILSYCRDQQVPQKTHEDARKALLEHYLKVLDYHQGRRAVVDARRIGCWYLKNSAGTRNFRGKISKVESPEMALELIKSFPIGDEG